MLVVRCNGCLNAISDLWLAVLEDYEIKYLPVSRATKARASPSIGTRRKTVPNQAVCGLVMCAHMGLKRWKLSELWAGILEKQQQMLEIWNQINYAVTEWNFRCCRARDRAEHCSRVRVYVRLQYANWRGYPVEHPCTSWVPVRTPCIAWDSSATMLRQGLTIIIANYCHANKLLIFSRKETLRLRVAPSRPLVTKTSMLYWSCPHIFVSSVCSIPHSWDLMVEETALGASVGAPCLVAGSS
jgi:hypothetical protein